VSHLTTAYVSSQTLLPNEAAPPPDAHALRTTLLSQSSKLLQHLASSPDCLALALVQAQEGPRARRGNADRRLGLGLAPRFGQQRRSGRGGSQRGRERRAGRCRQGHQHLRLRCDFCRGLCSSASSGQRSGRGGEHRSRLCWRLRHRLRSGQPGQGSRGVQGGNACRQPGGS